MADADNQAPKTWHLDDISEGHRRDLAAMAHEDPSSFATHAASLGISGDVRTLQQEALEYQQSFTSDTGHPASSAESGKLAATEWLERRGHHTQGHGNHAYAHSQLENQQESYVEHINVDDQTFENARNQTTRGILGQEEHFREFWDNKDTGYQALLKKTNFDGLTSEQVAAKELDLRKNLRRTYLVQTMQAAGTLNRGTRALQTWNFTYLTHTQAEAEQEQTHALRNALQNVQENHYVINNLRAATYVGRDQTLTINGKASVLRNGFRLDQDPRYLDFVRRYNLQARVAARFNLKPNQVSMNLQRSSRYNRAYREEVQRMLLAYYKRNKGNILNSYNGLFPKHFTPSLREEEPETITRRRKQTTRKQSPEVTLKPPPRGEIPHVEPSQLEELLGEEEIPTFPRGEQMSQQSRFTAIRNQIGGNIRQGAHTLQNRVFPSVSSSLQRGASSTIRNGLRGIGNLARRIPGMIRGVANAVKAVQAAGAAIGALASGGWIVVIVLIIVLLIIIIIILIFLAITGSNGFQESQQNQITYTQVTCSDPPSGQTLPIIARELKSKFYLNSGINGIDFSANPGRYGYPHHTFDDTVATQNMLNLYNIACILFGHFNGNTSDNTFGKLFKGTGMPSSWDPGSHSEDVNFLLTDGSNKYQDCFTHPLEFSDNNRQFKLSFENPDKCDLSHFQFIIARTMARVLAERAKGYPGTNNVFDIFKKGPFASEGLIPPDACQTYKTPEECFADAVGSYIIYLPTAANACMNGNGTNIIWLNSASHGEFDPHMEWISGQCSQASLAEVLNAYGGNNGKLYTIEQVAAQSQQLGVWDNYFKGPFQQNWTAEANHFNMDIKFMTLDVTQANLDMLINTYANAGHPVIVSAPNHYLVIWGGDAQNVWTLDSSGHDYTWSSKSTADSVTITGPNHHGRNGAPLTKQEFLTGGFDGFSTRDTQTYSVSDETGYWTGTAIVLTLKNGSGPTCNSQNGTTQGTSAAIASAATAIVNGITSNSACKSLSNSQWKNIFGPPHSSVGSDVACLDSVNPPIPADANAILKAGVVRASNGFLQCDDFVRAAASAGGAPFSNNLHVAKDYRGSGTAHGAPTSGVPTGYTWVDKDQFTKTPMKPGDIAIWSFAPWGHIAVVESVNPPYFTVAEGNGDGQGKVDISASGHYSIDDPGFAGWLVKQ